MIIKAWTVIKLQHFTVTEEKLRLRTNIGLANIQHNQPKHKSLKNFKSTSKVKVITSGPHHIGHPDVQPELLQQQTVVKSTSDYFC